MYISLPQIKAHLLIDHDQDDLFLVDLESVAEDAVCRDLNVKSLSELEDTKGMLPASVIQAMLLLIGTLYANRESVTYGTPNVVPLGYTYLIDLYRSYAPDEDTNETE